MSHFCKFKVATAKDNFIAQFSSNNWKTICIAVLTGERKQKQDSAKMQISREKELFCKIKCIFHYFSSAFLW